MITWFFGLAACDFVVSLTGDGLELTITGRGTINSKIASLKGSNNVIQKVIINGSDGLGNYAFYNFVKMKEIILSDGLTRIGNGCFEECHSLEYLKIPEGVDVILERTFFQCRNLQYIKIPKSLTSINMASTFYSNRVLKAFYVDPLNLNFSSDSTNSYLMSKDGKFLYKGPSDTNQIIPSTVETISTYYSYGSYLKSINFFNSSLKIIQKRAFVGEKIDELILPRGLLRIEEAFFDYQIQKISVPDTIEYFDANALKFVKNLKELDITNNSKILKNINGIVYDINETVIHFIPPTQKQINLSKSVLDITQTQVRKHNIEWVEVPYGHKRFCSYDGVLYVDNFSTCYACPGGKKSVKIIENCTRIERDSFIECTLESIVFPDGLKNISFNAFGSCANLTSINIPSQLQWIESWVFVDCRKLTLTNNVFPETLEAIEGYSFRNTNLGPLNFSKCVKLKQISNHCFNRANISSIILPPNLVSISDSAFYSSKLTSITIVGSVTTIKSYSFYACSSLKKIEFAPGSLLDEIGDSAFFGVPITSIILPSKLKVLGEGVFKKCSKLALIDFEEDPDLHSIGFEVIYGCSSLKVFEIQKNVTNIAPGAFAGASGLINFTSVDGGHFQAIRGILFTNDGEILYAFPAGREVGVVEKQVKSIASMAFRECSKLQNLTFEYEFNGGKGITQIGEYTFYKCNKLIDLSIPGSIKIIESNAFSGCEGLQSVEIGSIQKTRAADNNLLKILNVSLFENCTNLVTLKIGTLKSLSEIGKRCLYGCINLSILEFTNNIKIIGDSAFENCYSLSDLNLNYVTSIGSKSFAGCKNVDNIVIGSFITSVGSSAFADCIGLMEVRYCGSSPAPFEKSNCFLNTNIKFIYVAQNYSGKTLAGVDVLPLLDGGCNIPTSRFTRDDSTGSSMSVAALAVISVVSSIDDDAI